MRKTMYGVGQISALEGFVSLNGEALDSLLACELRPAGWKPDEMYTCVGKITIIVEAEPAGFWAADDEEVQP